MASKEKHTFYQEPSFQFFVKKGLIKQNNRGQVFPIFTYRVIVVQQKSFDFALSLTNHFYILYQQSVLTECNSQPSQSKYIELKVFPSKIAKRSKFQQDSPSPFVITNIPKKNTVYQSYIDNIVKRKLKDKPESPKKYCNSIHEIQGKQIETVKDCFLPKLQCLNSKPQRLKYRHSLPKQDIYTEPNPEQDPSDRLQPWDSSQKSFTLQ